MFDIIDINKNSYLISLCLFNIFWVLINIYQYGILSNLDHSGRYGALVPFATCLAEAIAPAIAGYLLTRSFGYSTIITIGAVSTVIALIIYAFVYVRVKQMNPQLADAA